LVLRLGPQQLGESLFGKESASPVEEVVGAITLEDRVEIWSRALYAIQDFPFTGCGLGAFRRVVPVLYPLFTVPPDTDIGHAHNIFLQTALDLGIPGLVAYLALLGIALAVCWQVAVKGDRWERAIALGLAGSLIALHAYGMTDALALGSKPAVAFWFALGLIAALIRSGRGGWDGRAAGA
jgi:putative inorganic carbon (HCO3(-)) transporter